MGATKLIGKENIMSKNRLMKNTILKSLVGLVAVLFLAVSCEINDTVLDVSTPGHVAASIFWDVPSTNVTAGNDVSFYAEYWSTNPAITYLGVWYNITKNLKYSLTYPGNGYTFTLDSTELAREFLEIKTFQHNEGNFDREKKAFVIEDKFPVSYTLSSLEYKNPYSFNQEQFNKHVPQQIQEKFLRNLFPSLTYADFRTLLVTDRQIVEEETFEGYFDKVDTEGVITRPMKPGSADALRAHLTEVPFSAMIYNKNRQFYAVEFSQGYQLASRFKIINGNGVENFSEIKTITVL